MKKLNLLFVLMMVSVMSFGQVTFSGIGWVNWANEPDYPDVTGYGANPYENPTYTVYKAPAAWAPVASVADFDATWDVLGDPNNIGHLTSNGVAGDLFDLGAGNTFGSQWKAVHDGSKLYLLLKYWDVNGQADADSRSYEIMTQPTSPARHEHSFTSASDSAAANVVTYQNMAYARVVELGGGKAFFKGGTVTEFVSSIGLNKAFHEGRGVYQGAWGGNTPGLEGLIEEDHFWNNTDGTIRAVLVMTFDGPLSYPEDPTAIEGTRIAVKEGDVISLDVKSNALLGGTANDNKVEYFWAADKNNGYASTYYSGHVTISRQVLGEEPSPAVAFTGIGWVNWANEPDYPDVTGYGANPYENPTYTVYKAPAAWTPVADVTSFDATWDVLGLANNVGHLTSNGVAGDLFDLGAGNTFGSQWKAVHDGSKLYLLLKYWDANGQADADSRSYEIMTQPTSPARHELSFTSASDSAAANVVTYQNMAYARVVELGGGKAFFKNGTVTEFVSSIGLNKAFNEGRGVYQGAWGGNTPGLEGLIEEDHFWNNTDGTIRAVLVMTFDGALSYPADPTDIEGTRIAVKEGDVISLDVKSNALVGGTANDNKVEYFWAADKNNGYASTYYSGHVTLSATELPTNISEIVLPREARVYVYNGVAYVRGSEPVNLEVYNVLGARIKSAQDVRELSLRELNNGIYLIRVNGEREAIKVMKY